MYIHPNDINKTRFAPILTVKPWAVCIGMLLLASCSSQESKTLITETALNDVAQQHAAAPKSVPDAVTNSLLNSQSMVSAGTANGVTKKVSERFDVAVRNVPAKDFFLGLVNGSGTNIVVHPDVSGSITLELNNVTIEDVLRVTRDIYGYEYQARNNIYTIYANALRTEVFQINYLDVQRVGVSDTSVMIGRAQSSGNGNSNSGGGGGGNNSGSSGDTANLLGMIESNAKGKSTTTALTPGSRVQTMNRTDFWASLNTTLVSIIGGEGENRSVMVTPQAGMVVVKAMPNELSAVREFLERSELSVKRQVILEAKILEVRLSEGFEAGVNWGAISGQLGYSHVTGRGPIEQSDSLSIQYDANGNSLGSSRSISESRTIGSDNIFTSLLQVTVIGKLLSLLETQGAVQVLSSPRISTVNNQKAVIRVGSDEYFVTGISNNQTTNAASTTDTPSIDLSPFFSGISLDVTPQISEKGEVILHIHPMVSEVTDQLKVFTVGDKSFSLPLALRGIRESDSIVKASNGQVIVLGGLMTESINQIDGKRPLLGDIPLLNTFFKTKNKRKVKTELVILLRPIVVDDTTWATQVDEMQQNMQRMGDVYRNK